MELEALQEIYSDVRALGAQIIVITPELERYTRALDKKLNLSFVILADLHLKVAEQYRLVFTLPRTICETFTSPLEAPWTDSTMNRNTDFLCRRDT